MAFLYQSFYDGQTVTGGTARWAHKQLSPWLALTHIHLHIEIHPQMHKYTNMIGIGPHLQLTYKYTHNYTLKYTYMHKRRFKLAYTYKHKYTHRCTITYTNTFAGNDIQTHTNIFMMNFIHLLETLLTFRENTCQWNFVWVGFSLVRKHLEVFT